MVQITSQAIVYLLCLAAGVSVANDDVTATRLDGVATTGRLSAWAEDHVVVTTGEREERLPTDHLVALRWQRESSHDADQRPDAGLVQLIDGSALPITDIEVTGSTAKVKLASAGSEPANALSIPLKSIVSVRLQRLDRQLEEQWNEVLANDIPSDALAMLAQGGKSVDHVEGVVGDISSKKIEFKFDGDLVRVDRPKVAGVIYFRGGTDKADPRCIAHGRSGLRAHAAKVQSDGGLLQITTNAGVTFRWPLDDVFFADFSAGKIAYMSDLEPASHQWTPFVNLPSDAPQAARYGQLLRDQSAFGGPLAVLVYDVKAGTGPLRIKTFSKGLALRSRTELIYRLPAGYGQFIATAGIDAAASAAGNARLSIHGDDRPLFEADIAGDQPPKEIQLDVAHMKRLKIVVDFGQKLDMGDWLNLCDARLVK
jgi:hypothetical protein